MIGRRVLTLTRGIYKGYTAGTAVWKLGPSHTLINRLLHSAPVLTSSRDSSTMSNFGKFSGLYAPCPKYSVKIRKSRQLVTRHFPVTLTAYIIKISTISLCIVARNPCAGYFPVSSEHATDIFRERSRRSMG